MSATPTHVVVLGLMGVGKSTTARAVAALLGWPERDSDDDLLRTFGLAGVEIAERDGVAALHRLEAAMLIGALAAPTPSVISAAASVVEDPQCRAALAKRAFTVVLDADLDTIEARAATGAHRRPLPRHELEALAERRAPFFDEVADLTLSALQPPEVVAAGIVEAMGTATDVDR